MQLYVAAHCSVYVYVISMKTTIVKISKPQALWAHF